MRKSYGNAYSRDYNLQCDKLGLIGLVTYPDGRQRFFEYDKNGVCNKMTDVDFTIHTRIDAKTWASSNGETWHGKIELAQTDSDEGLPGTVLVTKFDGAFVLSEAVYFPHGIWIESDYTRDRTEIKRVVQFLNGSNSLYSRHDRNSLWMANGDMVEMLPESPWAYALPWLCPVFLTTAAVA